MSRTSLSRHAPWQLPPREKVYEALSAVADGRVKIVDSGRATVLSSDRSKAYVVEWEGNAIASNDNASFYRGYVGYPVIAVLIVNGRLPCNLAVAQSLANVPWKALNTKHKRDYGKAVRDVLGRLAVDRLASVRRPPSDA